MTVKATIQIQGRPLRRAYIEHIVAGIGTEMYLTDLEGKIRNTHFDAGIDSLTGNADIRIICQNPIVRILDGNLANIGVYQDVSIVDGATVNLQTNAQQDDYYAILNRAQLAYEVVLQPLSFFQNLPDPDFPLGRKPSLRDTRDQAQRIDLSYPDHFPLGTTFVEPKRSLDNFPLMHIKDRTEPAHGNELFGEHGKAPTLIPHELSHALHFSFLSETQRGRAQDKYIEFITADVLAGGDASHNFSKRTTPEVAFIEALGFFSQTFMEFMRARQGGDSTLVRPEPVTPAIRAEFVAQEWSRRTVSSIPFLPEIGSHLGLGSGNVTGIAVPLLSAVSRLLRRPIVTGGDVEGAVYSAIFVDFASQVGLDFAASSFFKANALTFGQYREFIDNQHPEHSGTLEQARSFWGL